MTNLTNAEDTPLESQFDGGGVVEQLPTPRLPTPQLPAFASSPRQFHAAAVAAAAVAAPAATPSSLRDETAKESPRPNGASSAEVNNSPRGDGTNTGTTSGGSTVNTTTTRSDRLLVVANRLPMTVLPDPASPGQYTFTMSSGGLVSGLRGVKGFDFVWIGWPGTDAPESDRPFVIRECRKHGCHPVFLDQGTIDLFYNGFCNNVLWPLLHYIPPPMEVAGTHSETHSEQWASYVKANNEFVEAIMQVYDDNDLVWVHDYHLILVPRMLRQRKPDARIGWFLHTPFPSQEIFRMLPYRTELLTGLLSANFIGFHVYDYLRHFISSCVQLLGLESSAQGIDAKPVGGVFVNCGAIPIGVEPQQFIRKLKDPAVREARKKLRAQFGKRKVILGVDRLDYMKGLPHKLNAFDKFLELHPEWSGRCLLVQVAVPTRTVVPEYQRLRSTVHELVGMINGRRGKLTHVPVHYLDQSLSFDELVALYRVADVALITSIRDGMNLVAYEYIACQTKRHGVLILSDFTGAAQSLGAGSIRVNPWNLEETANAIYQALTMSKAQKRSRHDYALSHVLVHTSQRWAEIFIDSLREASEKNEEVRASIPALLDTSCFLRDYIGARKRLVFVDLLDALAPARGNRGMPMKKFKNLISLPPEVLSALDRMSKDPDTIVVVTTPHPQQTLDRIFANTKICLAAEKGCVYRNRAGQWIRFVEEKSSTQLAPPVLQTSQSLHSLSGGGVPLLPPSNLAGPAIDVRGGGNILPCPLIRRGDQPFINKNNGSECEVCSAPPAFGEPRGSPPDSSVEVGGTKHETTTNNSHVSGDLSSSGAALEGGGDALDGRVVPVLVSNDWVAGVEKVLHFFQRRTPGSYTERTTGTLTWYWDDTLPDFGKQQSRDLLVHLWAGPLSLPSAAELEAVVGSRFIEVRSTQCSRTKLTQHILSYELGTGGVLSCDFVSWIGNVPIRDEEIHSLFEDVGERHTEDDFTESNPDALGEHTTLTAAFQEGGGDGVSADDLVNTADQLPPPLAVSRDATPVHHHHRSSSSSNPLAPPLSTPRARGGSSGRLERPLQQGSHPPNADLAPDQTPPSLSAATMATPEPPTLMEVGGEPASMEGGGSCSGNGSASSSLLRPPPSPPKYYSISVGADMSRSKFRLTSAYQVQALVCMMAVALDPLANSQLPNLQAGNVVAGDFDHRWLRRAGGLLRVSPRHSAEPIHQQSNRLLWSAAAPAPLPSTTAADYNISTSPTFKKMGLQSTEALPLAGSTLDQPASQMMHMMSLMGSAAGASVNPPPPGLRAPSENTAQAIVDRGLGFAADLSPQQQQHHLSRGGSTLYPPTGGLMGTCLKAVRRRSIVGSDDEGVEISSFPTRPAALPPFLLNSSYSCLTPVSQEDRYRFDGGFSPQQQQQQYTHRPLVPSLEDTSSVVRDASRVCPSGPFSFRERHSDIGGGTTTGDFYSLEEDFSSNPPVHPTSESYERGLEGVSPSSSSSHQTVLAGVPSAPALATFAQRRTTRSSNKWATSALKILQPAASNRNLTAARHRGASELAAPEAAATASSRYSNPYEPIYGPVSFRGYTVHAPDPASMHHRTPAPTTTEEVVAPEIRRQRSWPPPLVPRDETQQRSSLEREPVVRERKAKTEAPTPPSHGSETQQRNAEIMANEKTGAALTAQAPSAPPTLNLGNAVQEGEGDTRADHHHASRRYASQTAAGPQLFSFAGSIGGDWSLFSAATSGGGNTRHPPEVARKGGGGSSSGWTLSGSNRNTGATKETVRSTRSSVSRRRAGASATGGSAPLSGESGGSGAVPQRERAGSLDLQASGVGRSGAEDIARISEAIKRQSETQEYYES